MCIRDSFYLAIFVTPNTPSRLLWDWYLNCQNGNLKFLPCFIDQEKTGRCSNPFKCPPKKTADGRKPRVKSNIKARRRNYFHPSTRKTNRIRGKPSFNQFVKGNLRTRTGKAQREQRRPFQKVNAKEREKENNSLKPAVNTGAKTKRL